MNAKALKNEVVTNTIHAESRESSRRNFRLWTVLVGAALLSGSAARAALDIPIGTSYSGTPPQSPTPWVDLNFVDLSPNKVQLTISLSTLASKYFVNKVLLNFDDTKNVNSLTFTYVSGVNVTSLVESKNAFQGDKGGYFDIKLGWSPTFTGGDKAVFDITSSQNFSSANFAFKSYQPGPIPPNSSWYAAAQIINSVKNDASDWAGAGSFTLTSVPEPSFGFAAAGCCLAGLGVGMCRNKLTVTGC